MTPDSTYICQGSEHGTRYRGWGGAIYTAAASALACPLSDKGSQFPHVSQTIERRRWVQAGIVRAIDESGQWFL
jgi:hypothetical protein